MAMAGPTMSMKMLSLGDIQYMAIRPPIPLNVPLRPSPRLSEREAPMMLVSWPRRESASPTPVVSMCEGGSERYFE